MKKSLQDLQTFVKKNSNIFRKDGDFSSPEYKKSVKEYKSLLNTSAEKILTYLEKKEKDFEKDSKRKEDPGNQKWEQLRIRTALHSFDTILELRGNVRMSVKEEDQSAMAEGFKNVLLSNQSKRTYEVESEAVKAERKLAEKTAQAGNAQPSL